MNKQSLFLCVASLMLLLSGCAPSNSSSEQFSSHSSETSEHSSSEVSSEPSIEPTSSEPTSSSENKETLTNVRYDTDPYEESDISKQLGTLNPLYNIDDVWNYYRGDGVKVAVIDSGFDIEHPEFFDKNGISCISDDSVFISSSTNGVINRQVGKNYVKITDGDSHGTMCAGLLGSRVNGKGIAGIAPNVTLMLIKIDKKAYSMADAFKYAADNGARVISTSLGAYPSSSGMNYGDIIFPAGLDLSQIFCENINYACSKGVTIVAATGNDRNTKLSYPAGCDNVIGAGGLAYGSNTKIWNNGYEGSNYNKDKVYVDVYAPSEGIYAPGFDVSKNKHTYWGDAKGTSFAAPIIAGLAALYFDKYEDATNDDFYNALSKYSHNISAFNENKNMGFGAVDFYATLDIQSEKKNDTIFTPTGKKNENVTVLNIIDEEGWDFRTLHLFDFKFKDGYSYISLEMFFDSYYKNHIKTKDWLYEGTVRGWAYTDEDYIGDYYLCLGNTIHASPTNYEYVFPSFVLEFSYQIVNNNNWIKEGGNRVDASNGYLKYINTYFWYDSPSSFGLEQVVSNENGKENLDTIKISVYENEVLMMEKQIFAFEKFSYPHKSLFVDKSLSTLYVPTYLKIDTVLYY